MSPPVRSRASLRRALASAALLLPMAACAMSTSPVTGRQRAYAYSWAEEVKLGQESDREIVDEYGVYPDPALTAYVTRVGEGVLARSHLRRPEAAAEFRDTRFTFRVLDTPIINAFALPGGYVYVTRGLLAHLRNEAQLAVVLGHEVGHVAARHTSQSQLKAEVAMVGLVGASLLGEELGKIGDEVMGVGGAAMQLLMLKYSRGDEEEADRLGVEYAAMSGYRAEEGSEFFGLLNRMEKDEGWFPTFLSTHPNPGKREQTVARLAAEWEQKGVRGTRVDQDPFYAAIDGIVLGRDPRHGFVRNGVFYHPDRRFRFEVPMGWKVESEQTNLQAVDAREEAGVIFGEVRDGRSARSAAADFVKENELKVLRQESDDRNGIGAYRVEAQSVDDGDTTRVLLRFVELDGKVYGFTGIAPAKKYDRYAATLERAADSFQRLTDPRVLAMQPMRLRFVSAARPGPFRALLPGTRPMDFSEEDMARLNHMELDQTVPAGTRMKLAR